MKKFLFTLIMSSCVAVPALAGSYTASWNQIGYRKELDAISCVTQVLQVPTEYHSCKTVASWSTGNTNCYAAECRFVMALSVVKTVWHLDGCYDADQHFSGQIWQTLPSCSGFLCSYIGQVDWYGRSPMPPQQYIYSWPDGYGAHCDVMRLPGSGQWAGDFYGSF